MWVSKAFLKSQIEVAKELEGGVLVTRLEGWHCELTISCMVDKGKLLKQPQHGNNS